MKEENEENGFFFFLVFKMRQSFPKGYLFERVGGKADTYSQLYHPSPYPLGTHSLTGMSLYLNVTGMPGHDLCTFTV